MIDAGHVGLLASPLVVAAVGETVVDPSHIGFVALLAALVGAVVVGITWVDKRIERKMESHAKADAERERLKTQLEDERHQTLLRELAQLRDSVSLRGEIRALRSQLVPALTPLPPRED